MDMPKDVAEFVEKYPDGTEFVSASEFVKSPQYKDSKLWDKKIPMHFAIAYSTIQFPERKREKGRGLSVDQVILYLLSLSDKPVYGRTSLFKQIFLLYQELASSSKLKLQDPKFVAYRFGPYSFLVAETLELMEFSGLLKKHGRKGSRMERFELGRGAEEIVGKLPKTLSKDSMHTKNLRDLRKGWDQLGTRGILRYVYQRFPKFRDRSELKDKFKTIQWGRGTG